MIKYLYLLFLLVVLFVQNVYAVPAKRTPMTFAQPDGSTVILLKTGDERRHMVMTIDGYAVLKDDAGFYCFADIDANGNLKASKIKAASLNDLSIDDIAEVKKIDVEAVKYAFADRPASSRNSITALSNSHNGIGLMDDAFLGYKELKGLVILAQYTDVKFSSACNKEFFERMLNDEGFNEYGGTGSARDYFLDQSMGQFDPQFDVYGPVTLPNIMSYYGGNDKNGDDKNPAQMIADACLGLDAEINFKDYDIDGDGYVDNVFVFYAGYGEASYGSDDTVWPHQWELSSAGLSLTLDGVKINKYACSNELERDSKNKPIPDGIGTFVHEFSHVLGLPDLYDTSGNNGSWTPSTWSVLDQGPYNNDGRTPPAYSVFERNALGWVDPIEITGAASITLDAINTSNQCALIPTLKPNEFFLIENRQQTGWDKYIPGHGMLVWHIDYNSSKWTGNTVNNTRTHNYVDIEEACGTWYDIDDFIRGGYYDLEAYEAALADYAFPGSKGVTSFTDTTTPSMKTWAGASLGLPITDIEEHDGLISFNVAGGQCDAETPIVNPAAEIGTNYFIASWNASKGADNYMLTVMSHVSQIAQTTETAGFGNSSIAVLPDGWSYVSTTGATYTSASNYGAASPSLKLSKDETGFMTREFEGDIVNVSFWLKGMNTDRTSLVRIERLINDQWETVQTITPTANSAKTVTIDNLPAGTRQLRFMYSKSLGNIGIDDVAITYGGGNNVVDGYDGLLVGNVTSYKVSNLPADCNEFVYKVCALDASGHKTLYSEEQIVVLGTTGVEFISVDVESEIILCDRQLIYHGQQFEPLSVVDLSGRVVSQTRADGNGTALLQLTTAGVYIVKSPSFVSKIVVK